MHSHRARFQLCAAVCCSGRHRRCVPYQKQSRLARKSRPRVLIVQEGVVDSDPEAIASFVRSRAPGTVRIGIETGPTTTWLWTELKRLGLPVICIDARHAKAVLKMQINKSDRNDAAGIARIMQTGWFKEVRVKDLDCHAVKALLASRALLVKIKRDLENQVRGLLKNLGLVIGRAAKVRNR